LSTINYPKVSLCIFVLYVFHISIYAGTRLLDEKESVTIQVQRIG
jgi:hypothetical protein